MDQGQFWQPNPWIGKWTDSPFDCWWAHFTFHSRLPWICKNQQHWGALSSPKHHTCTSKWEFSMRLMSCHWYPSEIALDVCGFAQFKREYQKETEKQANQYLKKITWQDYLEAIAGPYERAFTLENTLKAFEVTGTWPVDRSKITKDMTALAEGLSTQSGPTVNLSSPVKHIVDFLQSERALPTSSLSITSIQAWESSAGSPNKHESNSTSASDSLFAKLQQTRSAGLFSGTPIASDTSPILPLKLTEPITREMYMTSSDPGTHARAKEQVEHWQDMDQYEQAKEMLRMRQENQKLQSTVVGLTAKLSLMSLENTDLCYGLNSKVEKQPTVQSRLFMAGKGAHATGPEFLGELSAIEQEKEAKQLVQAMGQEIKWKRKELWHKQLRVYNRKCEKAVKKGLTHTSVGPKPLLRNIQLPGSAEQPSTSADPPQTQVHNRRAQGHQKNADFDSIAGDILSWGDKESEESKSNWSGKNSQSGE